MPAAALGLRPGDVFHERYTVVRNIATGGMGSVYEVLHNATRRKCALKVMLPSLVADPDLRARFQSEATIAAQIGSEHIVDVLDAGIDSSTKTPFIVMELLIGEELCDRIVRLGGMQAIEAIELLRQAALALDRTHAAAIIHRDLKPENFFISMREDGSPRMKILDFGIAKVMAESAHGSRQTGTMGTPLYMPPEQVDGTGSINYQADLYSFGQVTYAMLVGESYFDEDLRMAGGVFGLLSRVMAGPKEAPTVRALRRRNVVLPFGFDAWFAKASARRPQDRFASASEQVAALADVYDVSLPKTRGSMPDVVVPAPRGSVPRPSPQGVVVPAPRGSVPRPSPQGVVVPAPLGSVPRPSQASRPDAAVVATPGPIERVHNVAGFAPQLRGAPEGGGTSQAGFAPSDGGAHNVGFAPMDGMHIEVAARNEADEPNVAPLQLGPAGGAGGMVLSASPDGPSTKGRAALVSTSNSSGVARAVLGSPDAARLRSAGSAADAVGSARPAMPSLDGALAAMSAGPYMGARSPTGVPVSSDTAMFRRNVTNSKRLWWGAGALAVSLSVLVWLALDVGKPRTAATAEPAKTSVSAEPSSVVVTPAVTVEPAKTADVPAEPPDSPAVTASATTVAPAGAVPPAEAEPALPKANPTTPPIVTKPPAKPTAKPKAVPPGKKPKSVLDVGP